MGLLGWILFGLIAGAIARWFLPSPSATGCVMTLVLGIAGSCVGGFIGSQLGWGSVRGFDVRSILLAVLGAITILAAAQLIQQQYENDG